MLLKTLGLAQGEASRPAPVIESRAVIPAALVLEIQAHIDGGELAQAEQAIAGLVRMHANDPTLQILLGRLALRKGDEHGATEYFENALALQPDLAPAHVELARIYGAWQEPARARAHYRAALAVLPQVAELHNNLGLIYLDQKRLAEAEQCFSEALRLKPGFPAARNNLGRVHSERKQYDLAIASFRAALAIDPAYTDASINLGLALGDVGEHEQAFKELETCHRAAPGRIEPICALGHASLELARIGEAREYFHAALALDADCSSARFGMSNVHLLQGDLSAGWEAYESRMRLPKFARNYESPERRWEGEDLTGKTLAVDAEQGYGDTLMFVRFLPRVSMSGATIIFRCRNSLVRLMRDSFDACRIIDVESDETVTAHASIPLLSLGRVLGIECGDLPGAIPYLRATPDRSASWQARLAADDRFRVGLAWRGNPSRAHQRRRVPAAEDYQPLAAVRGVTFYNLEPGCSADELARFPVPLIDLTTDVHDFADTAALVDNFDLVISVDTSVAHLCGAMGKAGWVLYPGAPDWRWEMAGNESPWYPGMRLFRRDGGWTQALTSVAQALDARRC